MAIDASLLRERDALSNAYHISGVKSSSFEQTLKIYLKSDYGAHIIPIPCNAMEHISDLPLATAQSPLDRL